MISFFTHNNVNARKHNYNVDSFPKPTAMYITQGHCFFFVLFPAWSLGNACVGREMSSNIKSKLC